VIVKRVEVACVLDPTDFGEVIGVEVLDLRRQFSGAVVEAPRSSGQVGWSYDSEVDAFYVRVAEGSGQVQTSATGTIGLDSIQRVALLEVPIPPTVH
jgi:hypothetical protein